LKIASESEIETLKTMAKDINKVLVQLMDEMDLRLVDFKVEFGKTSDGKILLADEISPDTCRIWDKYSDTNFDKDVYRNDTGSLIDTYTTFLNKLEELK
ncbi:phosphoribosylaminoimidazolesuccinocarboxamide synthase, partial [Staphylococcus haemolyticus]